MVSAGSGKPGKGGKVARDPIQEAKEAQLAQEAEVCTGLMGHSGLWLPSTGPQAACLAWCPCLALHENQDCC